MSSTTAIICTRCLTGYVSVKRTGCHCGGEFVRLVQPMPWDDFERLTRDERMDLKVRRLVLPQRRGVAC